MGPYGPMAPCGQGCGQGEMGVVGRQGELGEPAPTFWGNVRRDNLNADYTFPLVVKNQPQSV